MSKLAHCVLFAVLGCVASAVAGQSEMADVDDDRTVEFVMDGGTPIIDIKVEGQPLRFALDPMLGPHVAIEPDASAAVSVRNVKDNAISATVDDVEINGALGRVKLGLGGRRKTVFAALIDRNHLPGGQSAAYDLAGGFEALPADDVIVHLNRGLSGPMRTIVFDKKRSDKQPGFPVTLGEFEMRLNVHFANAFTWLDRRAAQLLIDNGTLIPKGEVRRLPVWFGLDMPVQDAEPTSPIIVNGLRLAPVQIRTEQPLIQPEPDENVIVVSSARKSRRAPLILVGIGALEQCRSLLYERKHRRLTLTCSDASPQ